jgi:hypothetical protein
MVVNWLAADQSRRPQKLLTIRSPQKLLTIRRPQISLTIRPSQIDSGAWRNGRR